MKRSLVALLISVLIFSPTIIAKPKEKPEKNQKSRSNTGLVVGTVAGYLVYKHYKKKKEEKARQEQEAKDRQREYDRMYEEQYEPEYEEEEDCEEYDDCEDEE